MGYVVRKDGEMSTLGVHRNSFDEALATAAEMIAMRDDETSIVVEDTWDKRAINEAKVASLMQGRQTLTPKRKAVKSGDRMNGYGQFEIPEGDLIVVNVDRVNFLRRFKGGNDASASNYEKGSYVVVSRSLSSVMKVLEEGYRLQWRN